MMSSSDIMTPPHLVSYSYLVESVGWDELTQRWGDSHSRVKKRGLQIFWAIKPGQFAKIVVLHNGCCSSTFAIKKKDFHWKSLTCNVGSLCLLVFWGFVSSWNDISSQRDFQISSNNSSISLAALTAFTSADYKRQLVVFCLMVYGIAYLQLIPHPF